MKIIYLDQNAASFLANPNSAPIWLKIREALVDGFRRQKLICPLPFEGVMESAPLPLEQRQFIQALFWQLSEGMTFKAFDEMSNELTLALIRPTPDWSPTIIRKPSWAEMGYKMHMVKSDWKSGKKCMTERMNSFVRSPNLEAMSEQELFHAVAKQRSIWICDDLDCLLAGQTTENSLNCPWLIDFLISMNFSSAEIEALKRAVQHDAWAKIPIHAYEILLGAKWEYDSIRSESAKHNPAKYDPNDEIDRMRAAIALSHADLFITEGDLASLCGKAKANDFSKTIVLSVGNPERILEAIRSMIGN